MTKTVIHYHVLNFINDLLAQLKDIIPNLIDMAVNILLTKNLSSSSVLQLIAPFIKTSLYTH